tara:strand:+ start:848 stop:1702 length:855 start_codon:yes stop_codon:yes gene_type:complete
MDTKNVKYGRSRLRIKKFDIKSMPDNVTIAMIAKRGSGKSFLTRELLFHKRHIPTTVAISKTERLNRFYGDFVPDIYIYENYSNELLSKVYSRQSKIFEDNEKRIKDGKKPKDDRMMLIMDDCMSSKGSWVKEEPILELFFNGRHHHLSFILTMQYSLGIPPEMRSNFDYIFLLAEDFTNNRKRLYEHYAGMFPDFASFNDAFTVLTEDYGCMVINNKIHTTDITEKVYWFKAKETPRFTMGSKKYKKHHKKYYDDNWNKKIQVFEPLLSSRKKKNNIIIEKIK